MRVSEERLTAVLTRSSPGFDLSQTNPVAVLVLESMAAARPGYADEVRHAGSFLLGLLGADEPGGTRLSVPAAMQVLAAEEGAPARRRLAYLERVTEGDPLLRLSLDALVARSGRTGRRRGVEEAEAVATVMYLLLRMFESQEEAEALDRALREGW